jgi:transketolase
MILQQSRRADVGHIGSCLCVVEILAALYGSVLEVTSPRDANRDRFILSKGHAALAHYTALAVSGWIPAESLDAFCMDGSAIAVHPEHAVPGVDFSTGSLGQGICMAVGAALAAHLQNSQRRVYCLISDAECNEGCTWEAAMFAAHHRLHKLTVILDWNGQQAFGLSREIIDLSNLPERWRAFGWSVSEVDGHSIPDLVSALTEDHDGPHMILARTKFGRGVSFMEQGVSPSRTSLPVQPINWHYLPLSDQEFEIALREVGEAA